MFESAGTCLCVQYPCSLWIDPDGTGVHDTGAVGRHCRCTGDRPEYISAKVSICGIEAATGKRWAGVGEVEWLLPPASPFLFDTFQFLFQICHDLRKPGRQIGLFCFICFQVEKLFAGQSLFFCLFFCWCTPASGAPAQCQFPITFPDSKIPINGMMHGGGAAKPFRMFSF